MSDLVERLRDYGLTLDPNVVICERRIVDEAADRIEALEAENAALREVAESIAEMRPDESAHAALEARLAEAEKVIDRLANVSDLIDETEGMSDTDELKLFFHDYLFASWPVSMFRAARAFMEKAK